MSPLIVRRSTASLASRGRWRSNSPKTGITVNAICPGFTETPLVQRAVETIVTKTGRSEALAKAELTKPNPQGRMVRPEEVADAVLWLASPGAASINGQAIVVAGGEVMVG